MEILGCVNLPTWVVLALASLILIYVYGKWRYRLLEGLGLPGPKPMVYVGSTPMLMKIGFYDIHRTLVKKYGSVFGMYLMASPTIWVNDLDLLNEILVKEFSTFTEREVLDLIAYPANTGLVFEKNPETWKRLRSILSPAFSAAKLRLVVDRLNVCAKTLAKNFELSSKKPDPVDIKKYVGAFSMDAIASTAFSIDVDSQNDMDNVFVQKAKTIFGGSLMTNVFLVLAMLFPCTCPLLSKMGVSMFPNDSVKFFAKTVSDMIKERKESTTSGAKTQPDFLQLLLDAEEQEGDNSGQTSDEDTTKRNKKMTIGEILGQAFLFFAGGYETTATAMTFTAYALATNLDKQDKLIQEIDTVLKGNDPDYDDVAKLKYLDQVLYESLRMYPPLALFTRVSSKTVTLRGYTFPKDVIVQVSSIAIHRDPDLYPDPHTFKPERWEDKTSRMPLGFFPFGYGPRNCLGMRLAMLQMKIALVHILQRMKFVRLPDTPDQMEFAKITTTLSPKNPIMLRVELRQGETTPGN